MRFQLLALLFALSLSGTGYAHSTSGETERYRVGRYASVDSTAPLIQRDLLSAPVDVTFPEPVKTVGQALTFLLKDSGYSLASLEASDPAMGSLLALPLPRAHRQFRRVSLRSALKALAGPAWILVVDPVNRLISFDLSEQYRTVNPS